MAAGPLYFSPLYFSPARRAVTDSGLLVKYLRTD